VTLPDMIRSAPPPNLDKIVANACAIAGLAARRIRLLRHFANAVYLVEDIPLVARVAYGQGAVERSRTAVAVARWLATSGFPATEPASSQLIEQPAVIQVGADVAVSFWRYYPQPANAPDWDFFRLGEIAHRLHGTETAPPVALRTYQPLRSISRAVDDAVTTGIHDSAAMSWLRHRINELLEEYHALDFPLGIGLIHADLYSGNLLWNTDETAPTSTLAVVLGDWDSVCIGPREIDLAPTLTATRFGLTQAAVDRFTAGYGRDLRDWPGYPTLRAIRELSTLTALVRLAPGQEWAAIELRHRLDSLRRGDTDTLWTRQ
jgi:aminoglycoside phosphotransferase (APT) family kinase protein